MYVCTCTYLWKLVNGCGNEGRLLLSLFDLQWYSREGDGGREEGRPPGNWSGREAGREGEGERGREESLLVTGGREGGREEGMEGREGRRREGEGEGREREEGRVVYISMHVCIHVCSEKEKERREKGMARKKEGGLE